MSNPEVLLTGLLYLLWVMRIASILYSSYLLSESVTPSCAGTGGKMAVMCVMCGTLGLYLVPMEDYPRLSLANRLASIPSQIKSIDFVYHYLACTIDSRRFTAFVIIVSVLSLIDTIYMINYDWNRIE